MKRTLETRIAHLERLIRNKSVKNESASNISDAVDEAVNQLLRAKESIRRIGEKIADEMPDNDRDDEDAQWEVIDSWAYTANECDRIIKNIKTKLNRDSLIG